MSDFVTTFEIARQSNGVWAETLFRLSIGIGALVLGKTGLILKWRGKGAWPKGWVIPLFVTAWSLLWLYLHDFPHTFRHINSLVEGYEKGRYQVVEGAVKVLHIQPATGRTKGDIIVVNGGELLLRNSRISQYHCSWRCIKRWGLCSHLLS